jgi:uncharacterized protein (TIGR00369 family)
MTPEQAFKTLTGLELLNEMLKGNFPPPAIAKTLFYTLVEVSEGFAAFEGTPNAQLLNPLGAVHGGWALTLIDSAAGCAAHTTLPAGVGYTTVETKMNFTRPISPKTGVCRAEGRVIHRGNKIITCEAHLKDANGKLLAHGTSTLIILS